MLMSKMFIQTEKESPRDAEIKSHEYLIRANMIRKIVPGVYNFLPMGLKVLKKVENIVREEMDRAGCQEILCSALQPKELWEESGRWEKYGPNLMRLKDRHDKDFCLGPTHEEVFTDIVRKQISSYKQLPFNIYQIQTKYRDEIRPRLGLIRAREFIMKDAYSFDLDNEGLDKSYLNMYKAYKNVFDRCGLEYRAVLADTGSIGGSGSHQFMALSSIGESEIAYCSKCDYAADVEKAECIEQQYNSDDEMKAIEKVYTPNVGKIDELSKFLNEDARKLTKTLVYKIEGNIVIAIIRGDREINIVKLANKVNSTDDLVEMADESLIENELNSIVGFIGPIGIQDKNVKIFVDREVTHLKNFVIGANEKDYHLINVNFERDFNGEVADLINVREGDLCPECQSPLSIQRGIEVGQIFKLGTRYSSVMNCNYTDENGKDIPMVMGCYGIGVSRTIAAVIEQHCDDNGIIWPVAVAPYHVVVVPVNTKDEAQFKLANEIYENLKGYGIEVIMDDRNERPGVKFKDADLMGFPVRITVGKRATEGIVEYKERDNEQMEEIKVAEIIDKVKSKLF